MTVRLLLVAHLMANLWTMDAAAQMHPPALDESTWWITAHGFATLNYRNDGGLRGASDLFSTSMFMFNLSGPMLGGSLELRAMGSLDPIMGREGYPLLYQTGETADGLVPLVDRQHPHDAIIELGVKYTLRIDDGATVFLYLAPVGEPAIGPPVFFHRQSAGTNPVAPISHHWLDATHITSGVVTVGMTTNDQLTLEFSAFNGLEPDQHHWGLTTPRIDSWAFRVTGTVNESWSFQGSVGVLAEPEQLHPRIDVVRLTASIHYQQALPNGVWATTLAWGRNQIRRTIISLEEAQASFSEPVLNHYVGLAELPDLPPDELFLLFPGIIQNAVLFESAISMGRLGGFFRGEYAKKSELFPPTDLRHSTLYDLAKVDVGGTMDLLRIAGVTLQIGASGSLHFGESELQEIYGRMPKSWMVFSQLTF